MSDMEYIKLGTICSKIGSGSTPKGGASVYIYEGTAFIRSQNVYNLNFQYKGLAYITEEAAYKLRGVTIKKNDVLINITGDSVARTCIVPDDVIPARVNQHVAIIRPNESVINPYYLNYYLASPFMQATMLNLAVGKGASRNAMTKGMIEKFLIPCPTISIQNKIVDVLKVYDNLIENNNKRIHILEQMAENIYKEWFVRLRFPGYEKAEFENGIPKGWNVEKIKKCVKRLPFNQLYKQRDLENDGTVIVIDQSSSSFLGFHNNEPSHYASIEKPIILFGDHSCKFVLMIRDFSLGENVVPFITADKNELDNYYLYYAVHKLIYTEEYKRHWGRFTAMKIFVPQYQLQKSFSDVVKPMIEEKQKLWNENQLLIKQRDMLLPRLMSGKLKV